MLLMWWGRLTPIAQQPNQGQNPRGICSTNCPLAMALLRAELAKPFSARPALPVRHPPTSLSGSGLSLNFSLPPHPGEQSHRRHAVLRSL